MTPAERKTLADHEEVIARGINGFIEVGQALAAVRDGKLYRETHDTFEDYLRVRWELSRPRAYQLMEAANVAGNLSTIVDKSPPTTESQCRPLAGLEPDEQGLNPTLTLVANSFLRRLAGI